MSGVAVDSSAIIAIVLGEPERARLLDALVAADVRVMSTFNALETAVVAHHKGGEELAKHLQTWLKAAQIDVVSFDADHLVIARAAFSRFGRGRHAARLNLGDCCAYATARVAGLPLLCKGDDFPQTDVALAEW